MNQPRPPLSARRRRGPLLARLGPLVWIALLLGFWLLIVEWKMLPDLFSATLQVLS